MAPVTAAARLRDAIKSYVTYLWPTSFDCEALVRIRPELEVTHTDSTVTISQVARNTALDVLDEVASLSEEKGKEAFLVRDATPDQLTFIAYLLSVKLYPSPVKVVGSDIKTLSHLQDKFNIAFAEQPDKSFIVL